MLKVRDIMTASVFTVEADASAEEAAWALTRRHIGGAPVRDHDGGLVGMLTKGDLVNPEPAQWIRGKATVEDVMNPDVLALFADDPAVSAAIGMAERKIHRVVVIDERRLMVGIVTAFDIVKAVAAGLDFSATGEEVGSVALKPS
jgi:CBS-domain-containing membrane protein